MKRNTTRFAAIIAAALVASSGAFAAEYIATANNPDLGITKSAPRAVGAIGNAEAPYVTPAATPDSRSRAEVRVAARDSNNKDVPYALPVANPDSRSRAEARAELRASRETAKQHLVARDAASLYMGGQQ